MVVWACIKPAGLIIDEGELVTTDEAHTPLWWGGQGKGYQDNWITCTSICTGGGALKPRQNLPSQTTDRSGS